MGEKSNWKRERGMKREDIIEKWHLSSGLNLWVGRCKNKHTPTRMEKTCKQLKNVTRASWRTCKNPSFQHPSASAKPIIRACAWKKRVRRLRKETFQKGEGSKKEEMPQRDRVIKDNKIRRSGREDRNIESEENGKEKYVKMTTETHHRKPRPGPKESDLISGQEKRGFWRNKT